MGKKPPVMGKNNINKNCIPLYFLVMNLTLRNLRDWGKGNFVIKR